MRIADGLPHGRSAVVELSYRAIGRPLRLNRGHGNGRFRRISPIAVRLGEGPMSDHAADVQPARRERVFVPLRWFIAAAAAQGLMMSAHPFCEDEWIEA